MAKRKNIKEGTNDSMLHFVSQQLPSGTIGNHSDFSKYKDLDAIRAMMVKKLKKKDMPYSLGALVKLIKDTSKEYKPTESITVDKKFEQIVKENKANLRKKIVKKLQNEGGLPQNWLDGRSSTMHSRPPGEEADNKETNFEPTKKVSGQPDLEEHHEEYPAEILGMTVGDFLTSAKEKDEELYHGIESMIDKYVGGGEPEATELKEGLTVKDFNEFSNPSHIVIHLSNGEKMNIKPKNSFRDKGYQTWLGLLDRYKSNPKAKAAVDKLITAAQQQKPQTENKKTVKESSLSALDLLKKQSKDFPSYVKAVKEEFPKMKMDKSAIEWLKDDWDETNESIQEGVSFNIWKTAPDLIPMSLRSNKELYTDLVNALNSVYKKHGVAVTVRESLKKKVNEATDGGDNEKKHKEVESALSKIKGIQKLRAEFENPNKYGTILSSFRFDIPTTKGYTLTGELKIDHERDQIFIPQDGYKILKGLKVNDILSAVKNYYMKQ